MRTYEGPLRKRATPREWLDEPCVPQRQQQQQDDKNDARNTEHGARSASYNDYNKHDMITSNDASQNMTNDDTMNTARTT